MDPQSIPDTLLFVAPVLGMLLFALPSYYGLIKQRKALGFFIIIVLALLSGAVEFSQSRFGLPFGQHNYAEVVGLQISDIPLAILFVYPPLLLSAFWLASKFTRSAARALLTGVFSTFTFFVLVPAITKLELIVWESQQLFGASALSYGGWFVVGLFAGLLLHFMWGKSERVHAPVAYSGLAVLLFWTGVSAGITARIPLGLGAIFSLLLLGVILLEKQQFKHES